MYLCVLDDHVFRNDGLKRVPPHHAGVRAGAWSGTVGQVSAKRPANLVKNDHFSNQSTPIFARSLADIATSPCDVCCYSILARPKKWSILYRPTQARGPILIALCVSRIPHTRGVCAQSKAFGRSSVVLTPSLLLNARAAWDCLEVSRVHKTVYRPAKRLCIC